MELAACAPILRELLAEDIDETAAEIAYALATVGDTADVDLILNTANRTTASVASRRCLLGAARLFGVEESFYRLLVLNSIGRDQALIQWAKTNKNLRRSVALYHKDDEAGAIRHLQRHFQNPQLEALADHHPKDGYLLAVSVMMD